MKRYILAGVGALVITVLIVPTILVFLYPGKSQEVQSLKNIITSAASGIGGKKTSQVKKAVPFTVKVYRNKMKKIDEVQLEDYIVGVVAAEMPADFELEALKAQALAARTYTVQRIVKGDFDDVPQGAHVIDTVKNQVYMDPEQRIKTWGVDYSWKEEKIQQAVKETAGDVLTYNGQPIEAAFFSTGNGYTENAEDYWGGQYVPYLRSVTVPWDKESPKYQVTVSLSLSEFERKLNTRISRAALTQGNQNQNQTPSWVNVLSYSQGKRVSQVQVGDKKFSGRQVREKLGLNSSQFAISYRNSQVIIQTTGYGHGVGMSQYGANGMAKEGKTAEEIVKYFYKGIEIQNAEKYLK